MGVVVPMDYVMDLQRGEEGTGEVARLEAAAMG